MASSAWQSETVAELMARGVLDVGDGYRAKRLELADDGLPFARAGNINGGFRFEGAEKLGWIGVEKAKHKVSRPGDVVFTSKGTVGRFAFVRPDTPRFVYSPQLCFWRSLDPEAIDPRYLFSWMNSREFFIQVAAVKGQTDMADYVSLRDQRKMCISLPPLEQQRRIAAVLGALDDKIELNRQMNQTLEAMAQALFKSWFVDFDPVIDNAVRAGNPIPDDLAKKAEQRREVIARESYSVPEYAGLFPDGFEEPEPGSIPRGWAVRRLAELTTKIGSGATPRGGNKAYVDHGTALIRSQNVYDSSFVWAGLARITDDAAEKLRGVTVQLGDVLLNITGASILRTCVVEPDVLPARVNQHVAIVRAREGVPPHFLHQHLLQPATKSYLMGMDAGASRQAVTKGHIESVPVVEPPQALFDQFRASTDPLFDAIRNNTREARTLGAVRDILLPKLISGELRVPESAVAEDATA